MPSSPLLRVLRALRGASLCLLLIGAGCSHTPPPLTEPALSDITLLTTGFARAGEAYFSPDMQWIIFQASKTLEEPYQMYLMPIHWPNPDGTDHFIVDYDKRPAYVTRGGIVSPGAPVRISPDNSRNTCGFFSPDGQSLIFASTAGKEKPDEPSGGYQREGRNYRWSFPTGMEIFRVDNWRTLMNLADGAARFNFALHPITNNDVYDAECAYSPDGKWICFTSGAGPDGDIYVMHPDGTGKVRITSTPGYDGGPFFAPDGKRLLYRSDRHGNDLLQIFVADLAFDEAGNITGMKEEHQLTDDINVNWGPYFHPNNKHIIYATSIHGHANYELYLMRDDGTHKTRITFWAGADVLPVFSPDGKYLMWSSKRTKDGATQVFIARFEMPAAD